MTLSGCSITNVTAVFSKIAAIIALLCVCYVSVPYPYCYYFVRQIETAVDVRLFFEKNDFFIDCELMNYRLVETDKDIIVFLSGKEDKRLINQEVCR
jgi:hypothetical protein